MTRPTAAASRTRHTLLTALGVMLLPLAAFTAAHAAPLAGGGGAGDDIVPRSSTTTRQLAHDLMARGPASGRSTTPNSLYIPPSDSFIVLSHGFDDPQDGCQPRGWTGQDLTSRVFGLVSNRFTINNGFVNMGTRAFWFGADSASALDEISSWVQPYGYANGWSQRLVSPKFKRAGNPGATLKFDVSMELDRSLDTPATSTFTPFGLASGAVANDLLGVQALKADGTWAFLNGRFSLAGGPATWPQTPPLFANRYNAVTGATPNIMSAPTSIATDDSGNVYVADTGNSRILKYNRSGHFLTTWGIAGDSTGLFRAAIDDTAGANAASVAIGDLNRDGKPDLVVANSGAATVSVFLGAGAGGFGAKTDFGTGGGPASVAIGDVNGDGKPDLVVANSNSNTVSVLLGDGAGGFGTRSDFATGLAPVSVAIGDLTGDGKPDLAVANNSSGSVTVLTGDGVGGFGSRADFTSGSGTVSVAIGDLNGDGKPDLVTANISSNTVLVLLGNGAGSFAAQVPNPTAANPRAVAIGDLNGDGKPDLAVADAGSANVSVFINNGAGTFGARSDYLVGAGAHGVAIADLNGDGKPDLAVPNQISNTVTVLLGVGGGAFGPRTDFGTGSGPSELAIGDLDLDGNPDLVTANFTSNTVSILRGTPAAGSGVRGGFAPKTDFPSGTNPFTTALFDQDRNGTLDLAVANWNGSSVSLLSGNGAGGFAAKTDFVVGSNPASIATGDVNRDGWPDLVTANAGSNTVSVLINNHAGGFSSRLDYVTGANPTSVAIGDFNRDGKPDLAVTNLASQNVSILLGDGTGVFGPKTDFATGFGPISLAVGDLNGDGKPDLAVACNGSTAAAVLLGDGAGGFSAHTDFPVVTTPQSIAIADLNHDGKLDLVVGNASSQSVSVLLGDGAGGFGPQTEFGTSFEPQQIVIGDLSGDGNLDIAVATFGGVSVLLGDGAGGFAAKTDFPTGTIAQGLALGDVNRDGKLDLAVANYNENSVSLLLGNGVGAAAVRLTSPRAVTVDRSFNVYVADATNRVLKFTTAGTPITTWGGTGSGAGQFSVPTGIATDTLGNVYVVDQGNNRVEKFTGSGSYVTEWHLSSPVGVAVDDSGYVYVTDEEIYHVTKYFGDGSPTGYSWGGFGPGDGQFGPPAGIAVDRDGFVWVADQGNHRIQRFDRVGNFLMKTGVLGGGGGHFFNTPRDIAVSRHGDVYVVESGNNRFQWFTIGGPIAGEQTFKVEARLDEDGNQDLALADSAQVRIVMQTSIRSSPADGTLIPGQLGVVLVDNLTIKNGASVDLVPPQDFEAGNTGGWTPRALNGAYTTNGDIASAIRDFPPPATSVALRSGFDLYDPSCVWTFVSPGDTLANGVYARLTSPWIGLVPGQPNYQIQASDRLNTLLQSRFATLYTRGKNAGDTRPRVYHRPNFLFFGTGDTLESASPFENVAWFTYPTDVTTPSNVDSIQIVIEILDQAERLLGILPQQRATAHLPIIDEVRVVQLAVDTDHDGVPNSADGCPTVSAAGQDANGDGCVDATATMRHIESWAASDTIKFAIATGGPQPFSPAELAAIRAGFNTWKGVDGAAVPLAEAPMRAQTDAQMLDGLNLVTRGDPDFQFSLGVLAITPTTSFTQRASFRDRMVLPGQIVDSDMIFNQDATFTTTGEPLPKVDLQSVVTHEAGHMLGLGHSGVLDATMFFVLLPNQDARTLTDDDRAAIAAAYPSATLATGYGTFTGTIIRGQTGFPLPGALVEAVRDSNGVLADTTASDYSDEKGNYALRRLPPGAYSVRVTPLDGNVGGFPLTPDHISQRLADIAQTNFTPEWWTHVETNRDDPTLRDTLRIAAGQLRPLINIITTVDTIPPTIASVLPANGATGVSVGTPMVVNFSEPVLNEALKTSFRLRQDGVTGVAVSGQLLNGTHFAFTPKTALRFSSNYEIEISPELKDLNGLALADTFRAVFSTEPPPPVTVTGIQPPAAPRGALVTVTGTGFFPPESLDVFFGGVPSQALDITPTSLVVRVPATATLGAGTLTVLTDRGTSLATPFTVLPPTPQVAPVPDGTVNLVDIAPTDVALSPDGATAYAAGDGGFASVNLSLTTRPVTRHLTSGILRGLAVTPDGNRVVLGRPSSGEVVVMGANPLANLGVQIATIPVGGDPGGVGISPNGKRAYVTDSKVGVVHELDIDPASLQPFAVLRDISLPGTTLSGGVAVSLDGTQLYLASSNQGLLDVDLTLDTPTATVMSPLLCDGGAAIVPSGEEVLAGGGQSNGSVVIAEVPVSGPPSATSLPLGGAPRDVAVTAEGQSALTVNSDTDELLVVGVDPGVPATYHHRVSTVRTGRSPLSVALSSLSPAVAVANYGDHTLSIYATRSADASLQRVVPDVALPGDMVAAQTTGNAYGIGTQVDVGGAVFAPSNPAGRGVGFVVPASPAKQLETTVTLQDPASTRSVALPFLILDPVTTLAPTATGVTTTMPGALCSGGPDQGLGYVLRTSPDGRMVAMASAYLSGCWFVHVFRVAPQGPDPAGTLLASVSSSTAILDLAFTPDSRRLWVTRNGQPGMILNTDESAPPVGQPLGSLASGQPGFSPRSVGFDPLGRYMLVGTASGTASALELFDPAGGSFVQAVAATGNVAGPVAASPDGHYAIMGNASGATFFNLASRTVIAPPAPPTTTGTIASLTVSSNGRRAFARFSGGQIGIWNLDPVGAQVGAERYFGAPVAAALDQLVPAPDGISALASCATCNTLTRLDPTTLTPTVTSADIGQPFTAITRTVDGRRLWGIHSVLSGSGYTGNLQMFNLSTTTALALVSGGGQTALAGQGLAQAVRVRATDAAGGPEEGVVLRFRLLGGAADGKLDGLTAPYLEKLSDINGEAQVRWQLPATLGAHTLAVEPQGVPGANLSVTAQAVANDADILPLVTEFGPPNNAGELNAGTGVWARFNQRMNPDSLPAYISLTAGGAAVAGAFSFQDDGRVAVFQPGKPLPFGATCVLRVQNGARDTDGQKMQLPQQTSFAVESPPTLTLSTVSPPAADIGALVVIAGEGFSLSPSANVVTFGGVLAPVQRASLTALTTVVPSGLSGLSPVTVQVGSASAGPADFTVLTPTPTPGQVVGELSDNKGVSRVAFTPDGTRAYVSNTARNSVSVVDIASATILKEITVGLGPVGLAVLPDGSRVYVANSLSNDLSIIDSDPASLKYNTVLNTIAVDDQPVAVVTTGAGPRVMVANQGSGTVNIIDVNKDDATFDHVVKTVVAGSGCTSIAISIDGVRLYIGTTAGVSYVDLSSPDLVVKTVVSGSGCTSIAISIDASIVLALLTNGTLVAIDASPGSTNFNQVVATAKTGSGATAVSISPDEALAYVTSSDGNVVLAFRIDKTDITGATTLVPGAVITLTLVATIPVGLAPSDVALSPTGSGLGLVTNTGSGTVTLISFSQPPVTVKFDFTPNDLNLKDKGVGKTVESKIEPPPPLRPEDIVVSSIRLNGLVGVDPSQKVEIEDAHGHHPRLKIKFDRAAVLLTLSAGDKVLVHVSGTIGTKTFVGTDSVKVKAPKVKKPHLAEVVNPLQAYNVEWEVDTTSPAPWVALLSSLDHGQTWKLDATHLPNNGQAQWQPPQILADSVKLAVVQVQSADSGDTLVTGVVAVSDFFRLQTPVGIEPLPLRLEFAPIHPSPSIGEARLRFGLPHRAQVDLAIFDVQGRRLATLVRGERPAGWHDIIWDGRTDAGGMAGAGFYFARFRAEGSEFKQRMVWLH